jgi:hypothetical protein
MTTWITSSHSMNGQCVETALIPVEMNDGTYGKSSRSSSGGCVVARVEYRKRACDLPGADGVEAVVQRVLAHAAQVSSGAFNSAI